MLCAAPHSKKEALSPCVRDMPVRHKTCGIYAAEGELQAVSAGADGHSDCGVALCVPAQNDITGSEKTRWRHCHGMPRRVGDREKIGPFPPDGAAPLHRRSHSRRTEAREVLGHPRRRGKAPGRPTCPKAGGDRGRRCSGPHRPHAPDEHPLPAGNVRGRGTGHGGRPPAGHRLGGILLLHRPAGQSGAGGGGVCGGHLRCAAPPAAAQVSALRQGVPAPAAPGLRAFALYVQAVIFAGSIGDSDDTADWSGIIFQGDSGQVYGDVTLEEDLPLTRARA